jgi:hypothetical protein
MTPLYTIRTYDWELGEYTPQAGLTVPSANVPWRGLLAVLRELRSFGYSCDRPRERDGSHITSDSSVLVERTDPC